MTGGMTGGMPGGLYLAEHVAWRQGHEGEVSWVPGGQDDATVLRIGLDFVNHVGQLIETLTTVVCVHVCVPERNGGGGMEGVMGWGIVRGYLKVDTMLLVQFGSSERTEKRR